MSAIVPPAMEPQRLPHVLIFPFSAQGHINSMLKLAQLLCLSDLHLTFLNTEYNQLQFTDVQTRFSCFPGFRYKTISDGLPVEHSRSTDFLMELSCSANKFIQPMFRQMLASGQLISEGRPPVSCIIADGMYNYSTLMAAYIKGDENVVGKRPRPHIKGTTSITEFPVDLGYLEVSIHQMPPSARPHTADFVETAHFLRVCGLCNRRSAHGHDIFMYM